MVFEHLEARQVSTSPHTHRHNKNSKQHSHGLDLAYYFGF
jgi:hypothetical protein